MTSNKSDLYSLVNARLVEIGIWPIRVLQIIGLFPLKVTNRRIYPTKIFTLEFNWTIVVVSLKLAFDYYFFANLSQYNSVGNLKRPTEIFANSGFAISVSLSSTLVRLFFLLKSGHFIANWTKYCQNISIISEYLNSSACKGGKYDSFFEQLRAENRKCCIIIFGICLYMTAAITARLFLGEQDIVVWTNPFSVLLLYASLIFWLSTTYLHGAVAILINYCIKILVAYLSAITEELQAAIKLVLANPNTIEVDIEFSKEQELVRSSQKIEDCLKAFLLIDELSAGSNFLGAAGLGIIQDTLTASVSVLLYTFLNFNWFVSGMWVMVGGSFTIMAIFSSRLYFYSENANNFDEGVKDVLHQLVCISNGCANLGSGVIFKIELLTTKLALDPPAVFPGFWQLYCPTCSLWCNLDKLTVSTEGCLLVHVSTNFS
ncbi:unnamed protein product [Allacma fusca]|uniref:Uncharacterized protein n=1 Tax=Allacma fusca TaxID=39272 RepID=A0A8J2JRI3_9HEXA|nr:unnamed protein product [Allacma fusca]